MINIKQSYQNDIKDWNKEFYEINYQFDKWSNQSRLPIFTDQQIKEENIDRHMKRSTNMTIRVFNR